jgi:hypothetical protein
MKRERHSRKPLSRKILDTKAKSIVFIVENGSLAVVSVIPGQREAFRNKAHAGAFEGTVPVCIDLKGEFHVASI